MSSRVSSKGVKMKAAGEEANSLLPARTQRQAFLQNRNAAGNLLRGPAAEAGLEVLGFFAPHHLYRDLFSAFHFLNGPTQVFGVGDVLAVKARNHIPGSDPR